MSLVALTLRNLVQQVLHWIVRQLSPLRLQLSPLCRQLVSLGVLGVLGLLGLTCLASLLVCQLSQRVLGLTCLASPLVCQLSLLCLQPGPLRRQLCLQRCQLGLFGLLVLH